MSEGVLMTAKLRYIALHTVGAMVFVFVLNHIILKTDLQNALIWTLGLGAVACAMAVQHTRRWGD